MAGRPAQDPWAACCLRHLCSNLLTAYPVVQKLGSTMQEMNRVRVELEKEKKEAEGARAAADEVRGCGGQPGLHLEECLLPAAVQVP